MKPGFLIVALCVAACSAAPPPREAPTRARPVISADAGTAPDDPVVDDSSLVEATCEVYDPKNRACHGHTKECVAGFADCKCPSPPDVENPACWAVMACPPVPDRRVRACRPRLPPCPDVDHPDPDNPNCGPSVVTGRVIRAEAIDRGDTLVIVGVGTAQDIAVSWRATLLRGDSDEVLPGGEVTIVRVEARATVGKAHVPVATVRANPRIRFERR